MQLQEKGRLDICILLITFSEQSITMLARTTEDSAALAWLSGGDSDSDSFMQSLS